MGHTTAKTIYRDLGEKIDNLTVRAPWNDALYEILKALYSPEEAEAVIRMPYGLSSFDRLKGMTGMAEARLAKLLERLCAKGLVMDLWLDGQYLYTPSPLVIGIFEFTMMRTAGQLAHLEWARRFYDYMEADDAFYAANFAQGEKVSIIRALPYEAALHPDLWTEVLDYEKATAIIERADTFAIGQCACRHEKLHLGKKTCDVPLDTCSAFGPAADYLIRHHMFGLRSGGRLSDPASHG